MDQLRVTTAKRNCRRGATLVEAAFSFMIFILTVIGIMEFGRMVWIYDTLSELSREGTRYASVHGADSGAPATNADVANWVRRWAVGLDWNQVTVTTVWADATKARASKVTVRVQYNFVPMTPFVPAPNLSSTSVSYIGV